MKIVRNRKGISGIVATAILLTSVTILGTSMVTWSNGNLKTFEKSLVNTSTNMTNQINENLNIENIAFCTSCDPSHSKNVINVTVTNTGTVPVKLTQIQINNTIINSYYYSKSSPYSSSLCPTPPGQYTTCLPTTVFPSKSYLVSATLPAGITWMSKSVDTITITTQRGSILTTQAAPS